MKKLILILVIVMITVGSYWAYCPSATSELKQVKELIALNYKYNSPEAMVKLANTEFFKKELKYFLKIPKKYRDYIGMLYREYDIYIPYYVLYSLVQVESGWNEKAVNRFLNYDKSKDLGLGQINSNHLDWYIMKYWDKPVPFNPLNGFDNIQIVILHLDTLAKLCNYDYSKVVMLYHAGMNKVKVEPFMKRYLTKFKEVADI